MIANCAIEIRVAHASKAPGRGDGRKAFHAFLIPAATEPGGFGQYSYALFGRAPGNKAQTELYTSILASLLQQVPATAELANYLEPSKMNGLFIPLREEPKGDVDAAWLLQHYDYTRASALLSKVTGAGESAICLVSSSAPLLSPKSNGPYLLQDLSAIPSNLVSTWVQTFVNQAAQVRYWEPSTTTELVLKLRLSLSVLAVGVPQIEDAVKKWVTTRG